MAGEQVFDNESLLERYRRCSSADLAAVFADLGAAVRVIEAQRLAVLAVLDEREAWRADGARDAAGWVALTDAVRLPTARAMVEVARALTELPEIADVAAEGRLSSDQLRPLATLATPADDGEWAERAPGMDPSQLEADARRARRLAREAAEEQRGRRCLRAWRPPGGGCRGAFFLPDADGALLLDALDARARAMAPPEGSPWEPLALRRADALVELIATAPAPTGSTGSPTVVVHTQAGALSPDGDGWITLPDGTPLAQETLHRLGCDARVQLALHDDAGDVVSLGSARRTVPGRIRRLLAARDRTCRFRGCESTVGLHAHHVRFWSHGGRTEMANLVLLCHRHHALVHEDGWTLTGDPTEPGGLLFTRPDGRALGSSLHRPSPAVRERLLDHLHAPLPPPEAPPGPLHQRRRGAMHLEACRARLRAQLLRGEGGPAG